MNENTTADYKTFCEIKVNENKPSVKAVLELGQNIINELLKENAELKARADNRLKHWSVLQEENAQLKEENERRYVYTDTLKARIEKMKCCANCAEIMYCNNRSCDEFCGKCDKWELAE